MPQPERPDQAHFGRLLWYLAVSRINRQEGLTMTPELRTSILIARSGDYFSIMRTTIFTLAALAAIIELGSGGYSAPLTTMVVVTVAYGILAGGTALDDIINLRSDMDEKTAATSYGKGITPAIFRR